MCSAFVLDDFALALPENGGVAELARKIIQQEWGPLINVIWSTWEASQTLAFLRIPETQQHKANSAKSDNAKRLCKLANTANIRASGTWCNGEVATPSEKEWAKTVWPFPVTEQIEWAKGLIEICAAVLPTRWSMDHHQSVDWFLRSSPQLTLLLP